MFPLSENRQRTLGWILTALLGTLIACAPADAPQVVHLADEGVIDVGPDSEPTDSAPDATSLPDATSARGPTRALLLDFEMRPPIGWSLLTNTLAESGLEVTYRRWFPHPTTADLSGQYDVVFLAAGGAPATPVPALRATSIEPLAAFVRTGGHVVLMPQHGWGDGPRSANDRRLFNALLSTLGAALSVEPNTLLGEVANEVDGYPPLHQTWPWAYPTALEWTLQLPVAFPGPALPALAVDGFALGWSPSVGCSGPQARIWARSHPDVIVWHQLGGDPLQRITLPGTARPLAAMTPVGQGHVSILPRSLVELPVHSAVGADQPILEPDLLVGTQRVAEAILADVADQIVEGTPLQFEACGTPATPVIHEAAPDAPLDRGAFPEAAPTSPDWARVAEPPMVAPVARPPWFGVGRARVAYGDLLSGEALTEMFDVASEARLDALVSTFPVSFLTDYQRDNAPFDSAASAAQERDLTLFLGVHYRDGFSPDLATRTGRSVGPRGETLDAPPPLAPQWWAEVLEPLFVGAAKGASHNPGITGVLVDLELYGAHSLSYEDGFAFDTHSWSVVVNALALHDPVLADAARATSVEARLDFLLTRGLVGFAYARLEDAVAQRATAVRERVRAINPDLEFGFYSHAARNSWFYRGLLRGFGTPGHPVVWLTYDQGTGHLQDQLNTEGVFVRCLAGVVAVRLSAADVATALRHAAWNSDGFWLFQYTDFRPTDPEERLRHDPPAAYWEGIRALDAELATAP